MRRPWNLVNSPVYALVTTDGILFNVNICTYAMAVSRKPKLYAVALEKGSLTLKFLQQYPRAILQMLTANHLDLIKPLGHRSGNQFNKIQYLHKKGRLTPWKKWPILAETAANIMLETIDSSTTGDHELFIMKLIHYQSLTDQEILMFDDLVQQQIILQ